MNFTCPYCNQVTTITSPNRDDNTKEVNIRKDLLSYKKDVYVKYDAIACPNKSCKKMTLSVDLIGAKYNDYGQHSADKTIHSWKLLPESHAKPQPDYIPKQLVQDYAEACRIRDLSPKASATLARRCLQGMIRDFHGIKDKKSLYDEIDALKGVIPASEWDALDSLRSIGNIGAHMEKDVDLIIDVTSEEANTLIAFIEYLFKQWYVKRHDDEENLRAVKAIAGIKKAQKKSTPEKSEQPTSTDAQQ